MIKLLKVGRVLHCVEKNGMHKGMVCYCCFYDVNTDKLVSSNRFECWEHIMFRNLEKDDLVCYDDKSGDQYWWLGKIGDNRTKKVLALDCNAIESSDELFKLLDLKHKVIERIAKDVEVIYDHNNNILDEHLFVYLYFSNCNIMRLRCKIFPESALLEVGDSYNLYVEEN